MLQNKNSLSQIHVSQELYWRSPSLSPYFLLMPGNHTKSSMDLLDLSRYENYPVECIVPCFAISGPGVSFSS